VTFVTAGSCKATHGSKASPEKLLSREDARGCGERVKPRSAKTQQCERAREASQRQRARKRPKPERIGVQERKQALARSAYTHLAAGTCTRRCLEWATARESRHDRRRSGSFAGRPFTGSASGGSGYVGKREKRVARREAHELPVGWKRHGGACGRQRTSEDGSSLVKAPPVSRQRARDATSQHADTARCRRTRVRWVFEARSVRQV